GEIYALASSPSFDPNDFVRSGSEAEAVEKNIRVNRWLESEEYLAQIWDMKIPYARPRFDGEYYEEERVLTWREYLNCILPKESEVRNVLERYSTLKDALFVQGQIEGLLSLFKGSLLSDTKVLDLLYRGAENTPLNLTITIPERKSFEAYCSNLYEPIERYKRALAPYFSSLSANYDKFLLVDLYKLTVDATSFSSALGELLGEMPLGEYREAAAHFVSVREAVRSLIRELFLKEDFALWREEHFKTYLAGRRQQEKKARKPARPYVDYLEQEKRDQFQAFWEEHGWTVLLFFLTGKAPVHTTLTSYLSSLHQWRCELQQGAHAALDWVPHYHTLKKTTDEFAPTTLLSFLKTLRSFHQLSRPLIGSYTSLRGNKEYSLAMAFYPAYGFGFARSHAFRQATTIGSLFKLVPAYEALKQRYCTLGERGESMNDLNPLTIIDDKHQIYGKQEVWNVGFTLDGKAIPMFYRGGRLPRTEHAGVGKVDLIRALEVSSNPYFAMLSGDVLEDPEDLCHAARLLGFGEKSGVDLPGEYAGRLPNDITYNRTGLYAMSIG
ncbi:MAG: hypothetical protein HY324_01390, partial [Chlamydiia bacterium]|nr:hypothetical protein [Chlamydiia bacterium]